MSCHVNDMLMTCVNMTTRAHKPQLPCQKQKSKLLHSYTSKQLLIAVQEQAQQYIDTDHRLPQQTEQYIDTASSAATTHRIKTCTEEAGNLIKSLGLLKAVD